MALVVFVGGIFLGFSLGCATMAALLTRDPGGQSAEAQGMEDYLSSLPSPINKVGRALRSPEVFLTPWL
jgi:hypothetical protein